MSHASRKLFRKFVPVLMLCFPATALLAQAITVVSFGGSYARASQEAYHKPFTEETGIEVQLDDYNGGLAQIRAQVDAGSVYWDVVDLNLDDAIRGCDEGLFELMDPSDLAPGVDGSTPQEDFYPDMLSECAMLSATPEIHEPPLNRRSRIRRTWRGRFDETVSLTSAGSSAFPKFRKYATVCALLSAAGAPKCRSRLLYPAAARSRCRLPRASAWGSRAVML